MSDTDIFPLTYFETRFRTPLRAAAWPASFVIITAWATTGEHWSLKENAAADARLEARLRLVSQALYRLTGYSPSTGHAEPGWAVALPPDLACAIGREFRQHALYVVQADHLSVLRCADGQAAAVGRFSARLDPA